jgi:hypothetical protein
MRTELEPDDGALVQRLCALALRGLPRMYRADRDEFAFTRAAGAGGAIELRGTSTRYAAIVVLGALRLPPDQQRQVLAGRSAAEFVALLAERLPATHNLGDAALICWAAAQAAPALLPRALSRLRTLDDLTRPQYVVEAAWVVTALAAALAYTDVGVYLNQARARLLDSRHPNSPLFPHATGPGLLPWYRAHVACYADQVYPIQALAALHRTTDDPVALAAAIQCADRICAVQGAGGQWWWHYDARTADVVEGYPVYTVHQHAMGPMALLDLTEAGGPDYRGPIVRGLRWITAPAELGGAGTPLILDDEGLTWRKVYRGDPRKVVRAVQGVTTRAVPGLHLPGLNLLFRPSTVDRECRPYEFGWLLYAWLSRPTWQPLPPHPDTAAGGALTDSRKAR